MGTRATTAYGWLARRLHTANRDAMWVLVDRRYGFPRAAAGKVTLDRVNLDRPDRERYEPSAWFILPRILDREEVSAQDVFVDFGAGMGRVVFEAARLYPFGRVIGVELSPAFAQVARECLQRNRGRLRAADVEVVTADATLYPVPDDLSVAYFANPFHGETFATVVRNLLESVDRHPRRLRIVYVNPEEHEQLIGTSRIREVRRGKRLARRWNRTPYIRLYEVDPG